jgi:hypothetical protein
MVSVTICTKISHIHLCVKPTIQFKVPRRLCDAETTNILCDSLSTATFLSTHCVSGTGSNLQMNKAVLFGPYGELLSFGTDARNRVNVRKLVVLQKVGW